MHIGILFLMEVDPFCYMALSFYVNLVRPEEWAELRGWWRKRRGLRPATST